MTTTPRTGRAAFVLLVVVLASLAVARLAAPVIARAAADVMTPGSEAAAVVASAVTLVAASVLALVACWVGVATTWCVVAALRGGGAERPGHALLRPWLVRVLVGAALGSTALAAPAVAASPAPTAPQHSVPIPDPDTPVDPTSPGTRDGTVSLPRALAGLPLPDRPVEKAPAPRRAPQPAPHPAPQPAPEPPAEPDASPAADTPRRVHTVSAGESLWSIAADHLPAGTPPTVVDRWWRAVYDANRPVIGDDPDVIRPGTVLRLPRPLA